MDAARREQLESQLSAYLDGELRPEEVKQVEAFLAKDERARSLLEQLRATISAVRALPRARAPEALADDLRQRLERRALLGAGRSGDWAAPSTRPLPGRRLAAAAVIAITFLAGYLVWSLAKQESLDHKPSPAYVMRESAATDNAANNSWMSEGRELLLGKEVSSGREKPVDKLAWPGSAEPPSPIADSNTQESVPSGVGASSYRSIDRQLAAPAPPDRDEAQAVAVDNHTPKEIRLAGTKSREIDGEGSPALTAAEDAVGSAAGAIARAPAPQSPLAGSQDARHGSPTSGEWLVVQLTYPDAIHQRNAIHAIRRNCTARDARDLHTNAADEGYLFGIRYRLPSAGTTESKTKTSPITAPDAAGAAVMRDAPTEEVVLWDQHAAGAKTSAPESDHYQAAGLEEDGVIQLTLDVPAGAALEDVLTSIRADTQASTCQVLSRGLVESAGQSGHAQRAPQPDMAPWTRPAGEVSKVLLLHIRIPPTTSKSAATSPAGSTSSHPTAP